MAETPAGDTNWLWVQSRGHCAYEGCDAPLTVVDGPKRITVGEKAHIRAESPGGPRYDPSYGSPNRFENLMLMCRKHHRLIDAQPELYPVDLLVRWKESHEGRRTASPPLVNPHPPTSSHYARLVERFELLASAASGSEPIAIVGITGSGKTQLALDFYSAVADEFAIRAWIRTTEDETALVDFSRLGPYLGLDQHAAEPLADYCDRIRAGIEASQSSSNWLIVFDDAPSAHAVDRLVPRWGAVVLVTTQAESWPTFRKVNVGPLSRDDSIALLRSHASFDGEDHEVADKIADLAGDLPLCLVQAMGFIDSTGTSPEIAAQLFDRQQAELLARGEPSDHVAMCAAIDRSTSQLSIQSLRLLRALAGLASAPLPIRFLDVNRGGPGGVFLSRLDFEDAVGDLRRFSLVERSPDQLSVHGLVQVIVRDALEPDESALALQDSWAILFAMLPARVDRPEHLEAALDVLPHALHLVEPIERAGVGSAAAAMVLNRLAPALGLQGDRLTERALHERALSILTAGTEPDECLMGSILTNLANCVASDGDHLQAVEMTRRALEQKFAGGDTDWSIALTMGSLGNHLRTMGELQEALQLHEQAADLLESLDDKRAFADALMDQADIHATLEDMEEAERLANQVLAVGGDTPETRVERGRALGLLCWRCEAEGDPVGALGYADEGVSLALQVDAPSSQLARALGTRGRVEFQLGDLARAVADLRAACDTFLLCEGPGDNHARATGTLGSALTALGEASGDRSVSAEGLQLLRQSLSQLVACLPADHPTIDTARIMLAQAEAKVWGWRVPNPGHAL